ALGPVARAHRAQRFFRWARGGGARWRPPGRASRQSQAAVDAVRLRAVARRLRQRCVTHKSTPPSSVGGPPSSSVQNATIAARPGEGPATMVVTLNRERSAKAMLLTSEVTATGC